MSLRRFTPSLGGQERLPRAATAALAAFVPLFAALCFTPPAWAMLKGIAISPGAPTTCDSVSIRVGGELFNSCYTIVDADISGPHPLPDALSPLPVYGFRIRVIVQEPNPMSELPCTAGPVPYAREFNVGSLAPGLYRVNAVEYLVPWERPSTARDTSAVSSSFAVTIDPACPPPTEGCYLLDFRPPEGDLSRFCDAIGRPGGEACLDVALGNPVPVGGVQLEINLADTRLEPLPAGTLTPKSVTTTPRTEGFQVAWEADGSTVKALLFSADGKTIPAGRGPILNVCYGISENAPDGVQRVTFGHVLVADPDGNEIRPCPTFAEESGWICVGSRRECDVNGDGRSNILDIVRIARCALSGAGSEACPDSIAARADCNGDGRIDIRDVICCARRILAAGGPDAPGSGEPGLGTNFIGFDGPARWVSPVDGRATIVIAQDELCAGMQFRLAPNGPIRIRDLSVVEGGPTTSVEWVAGPDGIVRAMLYQAPPVATAGNGSASAVSSPIRLEVIVEPVPGGGGSATLTLRDLGSATWAGMAAPTQAMVASVELGAPGVAAPAVFPAKPNPFVTETEIAYVLPDAARASLRVFDVRGRLVRVLVDADLPAGIHRAHWNGRDAAGRTVAAGIYFVKLGAGGAESAQRLLRLR